MRGFIGAILVSTPTGAILVRTQTPVYVSIHPPMHSFIHTYTRAPLHPAIHPSVSPSYGRIPHRARAHTHTSNAHSLSQPPHSAPRTPHKNAGVAARSALARTVSCRQTPTEIRALPARIVLRSFLVVRDETDANASETVSMRGVC